MQEDFFSSNHLFLSLQGALLSLCHCEALVPKQSILLYRHLQTVYFNVIFGLDPKI